MSKRRARQLERAVLRTRPPQEHTRGKNLPAIWRERAAEVGLDRETIRATFGKEPAPRRAPSFKELGIRLTSRTATFDRRAVIQEIADQARNGMPAQDLEEMADAFLASEEVVTVKVRARGSLYTTRGMEARLRAGG